MAYAPDTVFVKRITPVPSPLLPLAKATKSGLFTLVGTGSQDHVKVVCAAGELWTLHVTDSLGLISPQDDVAGALALYDRSPIIKELERLDDIDDTLRKYMPPGRSFFGWLFASLRREISWVLPASTSPADAAQTYLQRFCRMLFEDAVAFQLFAEFDKVLASLQVPAVLHSFKSILGQMEYTPDPASLTVLAQTIIAQRPIDHALAQCKHSIARQAEGGLRPGQLQALFTPLAETAKCTQALLGQRAFTSQHKTGIVETLYRDASLPKPDAPHFPNVLTHSIQITPETIRDIPLAEYIFHYTRDYISGREQESNEICCEVLKGLRRNHT